MRTGGENAVHITDLEAGIRNRVGDRFQVQGHLALVRQNTHFVALGCADDAGRVRKLAHKVVLSHD